MTWLRPLWVVAVGALGMVAGLWLLGWLLQLAIPRVYAIARTATKESLSQPLFYVVLAIGVFGLLLAPIVPYYTFGEDLKMLKSVGLDFIKVLAVFLAVWTASVSIADEIEGRTALTMLSKPITRSKMILGKFFGVITPVIIVYIVLGSLFLSTISYKVVYDAREGALPEPKSAQCLEEMIQTVPGLALSFMEAVVLASISVAISTRLPMVANLIICASIYVVGHLVPLLVESALGQFAIVGFVSQLLGAVLPVLGAFSIETAISTGQQVPPIYLLGCVAYCVLYSLLAMVVALLLFEDRDLA